MLVVPTVVIVFLSIYCQTSYNYTDCVKLNEQSKFGYPVLTKEINASLVSQRGSELDCAFSLIQTVLCKCSRSWLQLTHDHEAQCHCHHSYDQFPICPRPDTSLALSADTSLALSVENRLLALEGDKELLQLQFAQMSDKLQTQNNKVSDLQRNLENRNDDLRKSLSKLCVFPASKICILTKEYLSCKSPAKIAKNRVFCID